MDGIHGYLKNLATLFQAALNLPELVDLSVSGEHLQVNWENRPSRADLTRLQNLPFQHYTEVFDPFTEPAETPTTGDIIDDILDIYYDLLQGLKIQELCGIEEALWHWKLTFYSHWGEHTLSALRALYWYLRKN